MFTPPNQPSSSNGHGNGLFGRHSDRRRPGVLPTRSSLSNSFSLTPNRQQQNEWDDSLDFDTSSVSFAHVRRRLSITEQGNRGIGQVSPRVRPGSASASGSRRASTSTSTRTILPPAFAPGTGTGGKGKEVPNRIRSRLGHTSTPTQTQTPDHNVTRRTSPRKRGQVRDQEREREDQIMQVQDDRQEEEHEDDEDEEEEVNWGMIDSMRLWRNDAIMQHLYETAAFWGDKILSWTGESSLSLTTIPSLIAILMLIVDPNDAFWLAQTYFLTGQYLRAERILTRPLVSPTPTSYRNANVPNMLRSKGKGRAGDGQDQDEHLDDILARREEAEALGGEERSTALVDNSLPCRYLVAQCLVGPARLSMCFVGAHGSVGPPREVYSGFGTVRRESTFSSW